ncbi:hypothetical protein HFC66_14375 [Escherichia coli]|nr:hypothetical protein [Escherichia coli]QIV68534.1 hypothetical protein HFC67_23525 [Escherichia coli]QIV73048.1 hypothetical protein HFC66_14375 [Escherichia coli]
MRAEIALMSGSAFAVTHHAFSSGAGRTSDGNGSHASTLKSPSYTKSVSWQHYRISGPTSLAEYLLVIDGRESTRKLSCKLCSILPAVFVV